MVSLVHQFIWPCFTLVFTRNGIFKQKPNASVPQTRFGSYFQKGKIFHFGKESIFPFRKNHSLSEDKKIKLSLCMSLVVGAPRNVSLSDDKYIWKFFTEGFENLPSSFFFNPENLLRVLSDARGRNFSSRSESFVQTFTTR